MLGLRNRNKRVELFLLLVLPLAFSFCKNAAAGTGYIDATGKWHFTVLFVYPSSSPHPPDITFWQNVIRRADLYLCQATSGQHRFGTVYIDVSPNYDALADVIIWQEDKHSLSDVYGIRAPSFHVFMSDLLRDPDHLSEDQLAKIFVHELGHYFYSLYDEYVGRGNATLPRPTDRQFQCIYRDYKMDSKANVACFMERVWDEAGKPAPHSTIGTWCYSDNHEVDALMHYTRDTWQSANNEPLRNCWDTIRLKYPGFFISLAEPALPMDVVCPPHEPTFLSRQPEAELIIAIDASISTGTPEENALFRILDGILSSAPSFEGRVVLISYNKDGSTPTKPPLRWTRTSNLATTYRVSFDGIRRPPHPNASLNLPLSRAWNEFDNMSGGVGTISRTFFLITKGTEDPSVVLDPVLIDQLRTSYHVSTKIAYLSDLATLAPSIVAKHRELAVGLGAVVYDAAKEYPKNAAAIETAGKQIVCLETKKFCSPGIDSSSYMIPDSIAEIVVSVSWTAPSCKLAVTVQRNGVGNRITKTEGNDFVGTSLKSRRYFNLSKGDKIQIIVSVPPGCSNCLPVTLAISDERPKVFLSAGPERLVYGSDDKEVVHGRVTAPYPLVGVSRFLAGEIDSVGEFHASPVFDDGTESIGNQSFHGDWINGDGIYSRIINSNTPGPLRTVRFQAEDTSGTSKLAPGESFSKSQGVQLPRFRRETLATYFLLADTKSTLDSLSIQFNSPSPIKAINGTVHITGSYALPHGYPNAHKIEGSVEVKNTVTDTKTVVPIDFHANTFDVQFAAPNSSSLQLTATLEVFYRTGDKRTKQSKKKDYIVGVKEDLQIDLPKTLRLYPSYPNPFNLATRFRFDLPQRAKVFLAIYDVMGRKIRTLRAGEILMPGQHEQEWDGHTDEGQIAGSGVYFVRLETADGGKRVEKIILLK